MNNETRSIYEKYGINPEKREFENRKIIEERNEKIDSNNKTFLKELFKKGLDENFNRYKYFLQNPRFYYFTDLEYTIGEIIKCLIIEAHTASITLTNHFLERILKLALIQKASGTQPKDIKDWNETYSASDEYSSWTMSKTVEKCLNLNIISKFEYEELTHFRQTIRNGFSHYDPKKILRDSENTFELINKSGSEKTKISDLNFKEIPTLQNFFIKKFAKENSEEYFEFAFSLMLSIERHFKTEYYNNYIQSQNK
jgi:hypothetical protein